MGVGDDAGVRAIEELVVPRVGAVVAGARPGQPKWIVTDAAGAEVAAATLWMTELGASDYAPLTLRSYAYDLLSWLRFLSAVGVPWTQATRWEVRDWVRWYQGHPNGQRKRSPANGSRRSAPGSINEVTGKVYLPDSYARATVNHLLASLSQFYDFALDADLGPLINPVPRSRREQLRSQVRSSPSEAPQLQRRAPYRQRPVRRTPRALSDSLFDNVFGELKSTRDKAIVATAVSSGLRASELLSMRRGLLHADSQTVSVVAKGRGGSRVLVPVAAPAFVWIARYLAERPPGLPEDPVWMTNQGPGRPLTYWALRQVLERVNRSLGSNVTMHDFRHTFCTRLAADENMTLPDMQELMRHSTVGTVMVYLRPQIGDLVGKMQQHWDRPAPPPPTAATGYDAADLKILFGGDL